eukprot:15456270-Alexandrium_andersonii.AAC.1
MYSVRCVELLIGTSSAACVSCASSWDLTMGAMSKAPVLSGCDGLAGCGSAGMATSHNVEQLWLG